MTDRKGMSFSELIVLTDGESGRWRAWFERQPAEVLELPLSIAKAKTVRDLLLHIFAVELRHTERLQGKTTVTRYEDLPSQDVASLFGIGERARRMLGEWLDTVSDEQLAEVIEIHTASAGTLRTTRRKLVAHIFVHGIRHWAQLATALREAGHPTDWWHDVLMLPEFE